MVPDLGLPTPARPPRHARICWCPTCLAIDGLLWHAVTLALRDRR